MAAAGTKLFVGGIPAANANPESLAELFEGQGAQLLEIVVLPPKGTNPQTRCSFVRVQDEIASYVCEALNGMMFEGHVAPLVVRIADNGKGGGGPGGPVGPGTGKAAAPLPIPVIGATAPAARAYQAAYQAAASPGLLKEQAIAEGRFIEAAEYHEQELAAAGETHEGKLARLCHALHVAAVQEHFFEASAAYDAMLHIDPQAAAAALATAIAASAAASGRGVQLAQPPPPRTDPPKPHAPRSAPPGGAYANGAAPTAEGGLTDYLGHIITFNQERRYGFVQCPELGADAFLSDRQLNGFQQGSYVMFNVSYNPKGQAQAQNLREPEEQPLAKRPRA